MIGSGGVGAAGLGFVFPALSAQFWEEKIAARKSAEDKNNFMKNPVWNVGKTYNVFKFSAICC